MEGFKMSENNKYEDYHKMDAPFGKWYQRIQTGQGSFQLALFKLFVLADLDNQRKLVRAFPEEFISKKLIVK